MSFDNESLNSDDLDVIRMLEELQLSDVDSMNVDSVAVSVADVDETTATIEPMFGVEPGAETLAGDSAISLHDGGQEETIMLADETTM